MKILVNCLGTRKGGSETFSANLLPELAKLDGSINYNILCWQSRSEVYKSNLTNIKVITVPDYYLSSFARRLFVENFRIPIMHLKEKYDWHFRADELVAPLVYLFSGKILAVFHATHQMLIPDQLGDSRLTIWYSRILRRIAMHFSTVPVAVSYYEKGELSGLYPFAFKKIQVVYHGVDTERFNTKPIKQGVLTKSFPGRYILSVSNRNPHKNYFRLVQAYNSLIKRTDCDEHLVIIGRPVTDFEENRIASFIKSQEIGDRVHLVNFTENSELPYIYRNASMYIFPSLFETFGMTPLEAMASGLPCAVSGIGVHREIYGNAACYFNPLCIDDISRVMEKILISKDFQETLIHRGLEHYKNFTWKTAAESYHKFLTSPKDFSWSI